MSIRQEEIQVQGAAQYNATVVDCRSVHEDLRILRIRLDGWHLEFIAGQYVVLGLSPLAARCSASASARHSTTVDPHELIKRPYSLSCSMLSREGRLVTATSCPYLEFYISQVHRLTGPLGLSSLLFALGVGDRLHVGPRAHGRYTLAPITAQSAVVLAATGTGEAPHTSMAAELLSRGHRGRILCVTSVRYRRDLGYLNVHRQLERRYPQYRYVALTTREPENIDSGRPDFIGKQYLQDYLLSGRLERDLETSLDPKHACVFLCGNPAMVGVPRRIAGAESPYPKPLGMIEVLEQRGFRADEPAHPGNVHYEQFW